MAKTSHLNDDNDDCDDDEEEKDDYWVDVVVVVVDDNDDHVSHSLSLIPAPHTFQSPLFLQVLHGWHLSFSKCVFLFTQLGSSRPSAA